LRKWADCLIVAPLSANTMAKVVNGLCDNLLTNIIRAWDYGKPIIVAPAMNTLMYENPITNKQINKMKKMGIKIIDPIEKMLMCGERGNGAMEEPCKVAEFIYSSL
jgi:phosphopantothenoylcysteine decarboxylase